MFLYYQDKATACGGQRSTSERYGLNMEKKSKKDCFTFPRRRFTRGKAAAVAAFACFACRLWLFPRFLSRTERGYAEPPQGRGLPRCPVLGSFSSPALRGLSVCSPSIADASGVALASIRRHNAAAFNALLFIPPPTAVGGGGLARGGFAPAAQKQTPLAVSLPFAVVTARGPDGLPHLPRLRLARRRKKTQEQDKRLRRSCVFFSACACGSAPPAGLGAASAAYRPPPCRCVPPTPLAASAVSPAAASFRRSVRGGLARLPLVAAFFTPLPPRTNKNL